MAQMISVMLDKISILSMGNLLIRHCNVLRKHINKKQKQQQNEHYLYA